MTALHPRQERILGCIADGIERHGRPPTLRELSDLSGLQSSGVVSYHVDRLVAAGLLVRDLGAGQARALTLTAAGYRHLGRPSPAADAALGRALRAAAEAGDGAARRALAQIEAA